MDWDALVVRQIEQLIVQFKEAIESAGGGMTEVEFTGVQAQRIVEDLEGLLRLKSENDPGQTPPPPKSLLGGGC